MNQPSQQNLYQPVPQFGTPQPDYAVTYVTDEAQGDVHVFVPDGYDIDFVRDIAQNFSRRVQEPVIVYHDEIRRKFRLCPAPTPHPFSHDYGIHVFSCDMTIPLPAPPPPALGAEAGPSLGEPAGGQQPNEPRIPRPPNSWILYRQAKSRELSGAAGRYAGMTASELSTVISQMWHQAPPDEREYWQERAREEERLHKQRYPDYKYTTKKSAANAQK
ncbi:unnamed protein product [Clonostachys rosea]|uniref:HMG box domain-containing protein n=1 Tax=Bionectria ochroleuca TaxID=29856 RepID=A0ABY6V3D4_BIOOC|nr:unnamed protein product [Clonostachys rosea]